MVEFVHIRGCLCMGADLARIVRAPFVRPDPPSPATARPMINMVDDCAAPQIAEPISNKARKKRNVDYKKQG